MVSAYSYDIDRFPSAGKLKYRNIVCMAKKQKKEKPGKKSLLPSVEENSPTPPVPGPSPYTKGPVILHSLFLIDRFFYFTLAFLSSNHIS